MAVAKGRPEEKVTATATNCTFSMTNTGTDAPTDPSLHPQDETAYLHNDIYRLSSTVQGAGRSAQPYNNLATAAFGKTVQVPVYVARDSNSAKSAIVTLTATSVSDPTKKAVNTCKVIAR